jgi:hypothetical protein
MNEEKQASTRKAGWSLFGMIPQIECGHFWEISIYGCRNQNLKFRQPFIKSINQAY